MDNFRVCLHKIVPAHTPDAVRVDRSDIGEPKFVDSLGQRFASWKPYFMETASNSHLEYDGMWWDLLSTTQTHRFRPRGQSCMMISSRDQNRISLARLRFVGGECNACATQLARCQHVMEKEAARTVRQIAVTSNNRRGIRI